jgi:hypothetical protein
VTKYISPAESARLIRSELKARYGWTSRQVSVKSDSYSMGSSIDIKIKAPGISIAAVEEIANGQESIRRCETTGEILGGGNRYVSVNLDWELIHAEGSKLTAWVEETPIHPSQLRIVEVCGETYYIGRTHQEYGYSVRSTNRGFIPTSQTAGGVAEFFARQMIQAGIEVVPPADPSDAETDEPKPNAPAGVVALSASPESTESKHESKQARSETSILVESVKEADQDFEFYPTTERMVQVISRHLDKYASSLLDIGAGDGRVLHQLAAGFISPPKLYAIEKSTILIQAQPESVIPVGTDLFEQNLACLPVDYIFANPPYSQFDTWMVMIIESGYARKAFLVVPQRWKENDGIKSALKKRGATSRVIHSDDFLDAPRKARAVVDIVEISYPKDKWGQKPEDPFNIWFDENISTFDEEAPDDWEAKQQAEKQELARVRSLDSITSMVEAYREEYDRMERNYKAIFELDYALLRELGVNSENVRDGIKVKMSGLKAKYWTLLFDRLSTVTDRLSTKTKAAFLDKLLGQAILAFTANNAYAVVIWAIKNANRYFGEQTTALFLDLSTFDGVLNYKSNVRTWKNEDWRFSRRHYREEITRPSCYSLDYRIVLEKYRAIGYESYDYINHLAKDCHDTIADVVAVLFNLGFPAYGARSLDREWSAGEWQDWYRMGNRNEILFQVKAHKNGNLHFRFLPDAIRALNVEAGRLLGWLRDPGDVVEELGYTFEEAGKWYGCTRAIGVGSAQKLLGAGSPETE